MTPAAMAHLRGQRPVTPRPWSEQEFQALLSDEKVQHMVRKGGFVMLRVIADEAEILTLAVAPETRRRGVGTVLVAGAMAAARSAGAAQIFPEVSAEIDAAINHCGASGFERAGRRKGYYRAPRGARIDALTSARLLWRVVIAGAERLKYLLTPPVRCGLIGK